MTNKKYALVETILMEDSLSVDYFTDHQFGSSATVLYFCFRPRVLEDLVCLPPTMDV